MITLYESCSTVGAPASPWVSGEATKQEFSANFNEHLLVCERTELPAPLSNPQVLTSRGTRTMCIVSYLNVASSRYIVPLLFPSNRESFKVFVVSSLYVHGLWLRRPPMWSCSFGDAIECYCMHCVMIDDCLMPIAWFFLHRRLASPTIKELLLCHNHALWYVFVLLLVKRTLSRM